MSTDTLKFIWGRIAVVILCYGSSSYGNKTALLGQLFGSYSNEVRPFCGTDVPTEVKVGMAIGQILDVNEPVQTMTANVWLRLTWFDCQLTWNPSDYGGIDTLILPYSKIWTPDITLYDNAADGLPGIKDYRPAIKFDGTVRYNFPTIINSICRIEVTAFPFDTQTCPLPFGSWTSHGMQINTTSSAPEGDVTSFKSNSEWDLLGVPVKRHVVHYGCCPEPFPDVTFYIKLSRKPLFYMFNLIFPCLLISTITLLGFLLPPDSGEKVSLEITVLLSLSVFMLVVSQTLPPTSENFPVIGVYFCVSMMLSTLSTVLSVIVINVHFRGQLGHRVPRWMRKLFLGNLARLLRVRQDSSVSPVVRREESSVTLSTKEHEVNLKSTRDTVQDKHQFGTPTMVHPLAKIQTSASCDSEGEERLSVVGRSPKRNGDKKEEDLMEDEWKTVAVVMDRLFFCIILVFLLLCTVVPILFTVFEM